MDNIVKINLRMFFSVIFILSFPCFSTSLPCDKMAQDLTFFRMDYLQNNISRQLNVANANVLSVFKDQAWSVVYVETDVADNAFLFYSGNIYSDDFVTLWSGAAEISDEKNIAKWAEDNVKGIPDELARCFAWYTTHGRNEH